MADSYLNSESTTYDNLFAGDYPRASKSITLLTGQNCVKGTLLGKITKSTPTTGTAGTNTGNGTCTGVTAGSKTKIGTYTLTCLGQTGSTITTPTTGTAGTNTGNGTCTGVTAGAKAKVGTYTLTCLGQTGSTVTMPTTGTAGTNTGAGTCTGVTAGANAQAGTYTLRCITTSSGAGTFEVLTPTGERLSDATVGVAYTSNQINFTLNDGTPDFALADSFTILASAVNAGLFQVRDPEGNLMPDATVAVAYTNNQLNFTINDGSTDFVAGDTFTVPVATGSGKYKTALAASVDGSQDLDTAVILAEDKDATSEDKTTIGYETGEFAYNEMTFGTGYTYSNTTESLAKRGIFLRNSVTA